MRTRCDRTAAWAALQDIYKAGGKGFDLRQAFDSDANRFAALSQQTPHVFADMSKNLLDGATESLLLDLARQTGVQAHRDAMFAGEAINSTENRAVMHWLLRKPAQAHIDIQQLAINNVANKALAHDLMQVHTTLDAMLAYAQVVRADDAITDVVNIGIGGSDLGPQMAVLALDEFVTPAKRFHFVSNVDGHELAATLKRLKPHSTLFLIASKTFTTIRP